MDWHFRSPTAFEVSNAAKVLERYNVEDSNYGAGCRSLVGFPVTESSIESLQMWVAGKELDRGTTVRVNGMIAQMRFDVDTIRDYSSTLAETDDGFTVVKTFFACRQSREQRNARDILLCFCSAHFKKNTDPLYQRIFEFFFGSSSGTVGPEFVEALDVMCRQKMAQVIYS
jgi:hypothetical protein